MRESLYLYSLQSSHYREWEFVSFSMTKCHIQAASNNFQFPWSRMKALERKVSFEAALLTGRQPSLPGFTHVLLSVTLPYFPKKCLFWMDEYSPPQAPAVQWVSLSGSETSVQNYSIHGLLYQSKSRDLPGDKTAAETECDLILGIISGLCVPSLFMSLQKNSTIDSNWMFTLACFSHCFNDTFRDKRKLLVWNSMRWYTMGSANIYRFLTCT